MARWNSLEDGSTVVETDDGRKIRTAVQPDALASQFDMSHDPTLTLDEQQGAQVTDLMTQLGDIRAKYDPDYAASREKAVPQRTATSPNEREQYERQMQQLDTQRQQMRDEMMSGATSELSLPQGRDASIRAAAGRAASPPTATDATHAAPLPQGRDASIRAAAAREASMPGAPAAPTPGAPAGARTRFVPDTSGARGNASMASYAAGQQAQGGGDPVMNEIASFALKNAVRRSGPTKGGWQPRSQTTEVSELPPRENLEAVDAAEMGEEDVASANAEAKAQGYREQVVGPQLQALQQDLGALDSAYARRKRYDDEISRLNKVATDTEKKADTMKSVSSSDDFFENHGGTFGRLLAGVAAGMGAFAQGITGQPNTALQIINSAIADHGQMLKDRYERAVASGRNARNAYSEALKLYGDPETAMQALTLKGETLSDKMMKVQIGRHASAQEQAQLDQWLEQRKVARAARWADVAGKAAGRVVSQTAYVPGSSGGSSIDRNMLELGLKARGEANKAGQGDEISLRKDIDARSRAVRIPGDDSARLGTPELFAGDKERAAKASAALRQAAKANTAIQRMREIYNTPNWETSPDLVTDLESQGAVLQPLLSGPLELRSQTSDEMAKITDPLKGVQGAQWGKLDSQGLKALEVTNRIFETEKKEWMRELTRSPYQPDYAEPDVPSRRMR